MGVYARYLPQETTHPRAYRFVSVKSCARPCPSTLFVRNTRVPPFFRRGRRKRGEKRDLLQDQRRPTCPPVRRMCGLLYVHAHFRVHEASHRFLCAQNVTKCECPVVVLVASLWSTYWLLRTRLFFFRFASAHILKGVSEFNVHCAYPLPLRMMLLAVCTACFYR